MNQLVMNRGLMASTRGVLDSPSCPAAVTLSPSEQINLPTQPRGEDQGGAPSFSTAGQGLTLADYSERWSLPSDWLASEFNLRDARHGAVNGVEIPYRGVGGPVYGTHFLAAAQDECNFDCPDHDPLASRVYGLDLLESYKDGTLWIGETEPDLHVARLHGVQCLVMKHPSSLDLLARAICQTAAIKKVVVFIGERGEMLGEMLTKKLNDREWAGQVVEINPRPLVGADDLSGLHVALHGDRAAFKAAVVRLEGAAQAVALKLSHKLTDCGNAKRFIDQHGQDLRFHVKKGAWLAWDGRRWAEDETGEQQRRAKQTAKSIYFEAGQADGDESSKLAQWAQKSESLQHIEAMLKLAQTEPGVAVTPAMLDSNPYLLNVQNGTIDLTTGKLQPHRREDLITCVCPVDYHPHAACPTWEQMLDLITGSNKDLQAYIQRAVGYTLTGDTGEECLFFAYGHGKNGKSTFMETLFAILGNHSAKTSAESLMTRRSGGISNDIARLDGPRFVLASELEENRRWSEAQVKDLTGNDTITARFLHREFFEFKPKFKIWCYGNHKPNVGGTDTGFWRRMRLIPFTVTIREDKRVSRTVLDKKLKAEWPGILAWAVRGCLAWQQQGLGSCPDVDKATDDYRSENDVLEVFLYEKCDRDQNARTKVGDLYTEYKNWVLDSGEYQWTKSVFTKRMKEKGFSVIKSNGQSKFDGITTKSEEDRAASWLNNCTLGGRVAPVAAVV